MASNFGSRVFTPVVKALQEQHGTRKAYEHLASSGASTDVLGEFEVDFLAHRDSFYMASIGSTGWPYVQHRGGPVGFLKVIDPSTVAFADYRGNKQYISTGNLATDDRVALISVDYPHQARLKILGRVKIIDRENAADLIEKLQKDDVKAVIERVYVIHVEAFDWNCPKHITPRFTADEIRDVLAPFEARMQTLEEENKRLRYELSQKTA
jgi:predicted pyridoxine 5'-phosphate oxidase superfamily flavin-nucleotide-binding protein